MVLHGFGINDKFLLSQLYGAVIFGYFVEVLRASVRGIASKYFVSHVSIITGNYVSGITDEVFGRRKRFPMSANKPTLDF